MGSTEIHIIHENNLMSKLDCYSQSTHSLPAMVSGVQSDHLKRFQSQLDISVHEKKKFVPQFSRTDLDSIENVCKFINNNSEPNLMELPGFKVKQTVARPARDQVPSALRLKIFVHEEKVLKTTLKSKDMTIGHLHSSIVNKLQLSESESSHFCLCKRLEDEFLYIPSNEKVLDQKTNMFYLRLIKPLNTSLRKKLYDSKFDVRNCGNFAFKGRINKKSDSSCVKMVINSSGIEINCDFILWKYVSQVSYSATFLQILYKQNQGLSKKKVCFESEKIRSIYELIMFFMELEKMKKASIEVEPEGSKPKEDETKFENFCKKLCNLTKDAVKSIGTPRRKRSKSIDSHTYSKPKKKNLNRSLSSTDMHRVKRNIFEELRDPVAPPCDEKRESTVSVKRKSETHLEQAPMKRTKIVTNPRIPEKENHSSSSTSVSVTIPQFPQTSVHTSQGSLRRKGRTPVRMGVRSVASSKHPAPVPGERKIFYTTALRSDFTYFGIKLLASSGGVYIETVALRDNCKFLPGDRILAINGMSLENCGLDKAEHLLEASGQFVNFIISRKL